MVDDDRIARVARAMCVADGNDPDADHILHEFDDVQSRIREIVVPRWTTYAGEARRTIAAARAMGLIE